MARMTRDFWGQAFATREGVEYGPFDIDLEKVLGWDDVFAYCEDELQGKYLELARVVDKDADFVNPETGEELAWHDFDWSFDAGDHDDFFEDCCLSYFGQAYRGSYRDGAAFAEQEYSEMIEDRHLLQYLVIDWEATWQGMHDYVEYGDGYFFRNM